MKATPYLPTRIRGARIEDALFNITTAAGEESIPLASIKLLCLGVIDEINITSTIQPSGLRSMIQKVLLGSPDEDIHQKSKQAPKKRTYYLDFFVAGRVQPYRIESTSMNYKGLIIASPTTIEWEKEEWHTAEICSLSKSGRRGVPEVRVNTTKAPDLRYPTSIDNFKELIGLILNNTKSASLNEACLLYKEKKRLDEKVYSTLYEFQRESMELWINIQSMENEENKKEKENGS